MAWEVVSEKTIQADRFTIQCEKVVLKEKTYNFSHVALRQGVCILAITDNDEVACIKQYRHAFKTDLWELPAGAIDGEEQPLVAAKRELLEEVGIEAEEWVNLGYFYPSPGSTSEVIHLFLAKQLTYKEQQLEETEQIEKVIISQQKLEALISDNQFLHGAGLAAYAKYKVIKK